MSNVACFSTLYIHTYSNRSTHNCNRYQSRCTIILMLNFIQSCMAILAVSAELLDSWSKVTSWDSPFPLWLYTLRTMTNGCILYAVKFTAAVNIFSHFMPICHSVGMWLPTILSVCLEIGLRISCIENDYLHGIDWLMIDENQEVMYT